MTTLVSGLFRIDSLCCLRQRHALFLNSGDDLDLGDSISRYQPRDLNRGPRWERLLHIAVFYCDHCGHLRREVSMEAGNIHNVVPTGAGILEYCTDPFESARVAELEIGFAIANANHD